MQTANPLRSAGESRYVTIRGNWSPPAFDTAFTYIQKCIKRREEIVVLCTFNGNQLEIILTGYAPCTGMGRTGLRGHGTMSIMKGNTTMEIVIKVLGSVSGFGTAVLIDENDCVWLYNAPDTTDPQLPGFPEKAIMVLKKGESGGIHQVLTLDNCYDANVDTDESEHDLLMDIGISG